VLRADSLYVSKPIQMYFSLNKRDEVEIVSVFRQGYTLLPHADLVLRAGDRLLAIASPEGRERLAQHLTPLSQGQVIPVATQASP
jgi:Trk K+ transport system NAD-binding subunit